MLPDFSALGLWGAWVIFSKDEALIVGCERSVVHCMILVMTLQLMTCSSFLRCASVLADLPAFDQGRRGRAEPGGGQPAGPV